jgi:hypothetical protein
MAGGKFKKPQRGGGRTFSRRIEAVHSNNAVRLCLVPHFLTITSGKRGPKTKAKKSVHADPMATTITNTNQTAN